MPDITKTRTDLIDRAATPVASLPTTSLSRQELRAYDPTWRDSIANWLMTRGPGDAGHRPGYQPSLARQNFVSGLMGSTGFGTTGIGLADLTPLGIVFEVQEALQEGDYKRAALGLLPGAALAKAGMRSLQRSASASAPPPIGQFAQYAEHYPPLGPPVLYRKGTRTRISFSSQAEADDLVRQGKAYWGKSLPPETKAFVRARRAIQRDMEANGFQPYFDPAKRADVNSDHYPMDAGPVVGMPAKMETARKHWERLISNGSMQRLKAAFRRGSQAPDGDGWHALKQVEDEYVKLLGAKAGRKAFRDELVGPIAAMTAGNNPTANFVLAHFAEFLRKSGSPLPKNAYEWPYPIGGRYAASNARMYEKYLRDGRTIGFSNPKRREFLASMLGFRDRHVIDSRISDVLEPGRRTPRNYGIASRIMDEVAKEVGARDRRHLGDAVWAAEEHKTTRRAADSGSTPPGAGHNSRKYFNFDRLAITVINAIIERTHRLTGMPRDEIFLRGFILKEIPLYGIGGAAIAPIAVDSLHPRSEVN